MSFIALSLLLLQLSAPPKEIERIRPIYSSKTYGFGTPVSLTTMVTAFHVVDPEDIYQVDGQDQVVVVKKDPKGDLALVRTGEPRVPLEIAQDLPEVQEEVFYRCILAGMVPTTVRARYLGKDADGDIALDGTAIPGCSGSGVLNTNGKLIGVLSAVWTPNNGPSYLVIAKDVRKFLKEK